MKPPRCLETTETTQRRAWRLVSDDVGPKYFKCILSVWVTVQYTGYERTLVICVLNSHLKRVTIPDAVLVLLWFDVCCCYGVVRLGWCGILMQAEALHYLLLNMFRMLVHPSSGACDLLWIYFMCCVALIRCVLVLRCGSAGVVWYPYTG